MPFALVYSIIFYMSGRTVSELPSGIPDIIPHFIEFFLLSFLFMRIVKNGGSKKLFLSLLFLLLLSVLDEVHQLFVPTRNFSVKDILFDLIGIIAGISFYKSKFLNYIK